jgi:hypothetical protein
MDDDDDVGVVDERGACTTVAMTNRIGSLYWLARWLNDDEKGELGRGS